MKTVTDFLKYRCYTATYYPNSKATENGHKVKEYQCLVFLSESTKDGITLLEFWDDPGQERIFVDKDFLGKSDYGWSFTYKGIGNYIWHVHSGVDAFELTTVYGKIYMPYISIICSSPRTARRKAAEILGQKLEDQDTNLGYVNYVDFPEFIRVHSI